MITPTIDKLARQGVVRALGAGHTRVTGVTLTRFYTPKECAPSRTSMMTGRDPFRCLSRPHPMLGRWRAGVCCCRYGYYRNPSDDGGVPLNFTMIPEVLKRAGYRTAAIGKQLLHY